VSFVQGQLPCPAHRWRVSEQVDATHRYPSHCVHCGATRAFTGGEPDNPFSERQQKWGEAGIDSRRPKVSGKQHRRTELVLSAEHSGAYQAHAKKMAKAAPARKPQHGTRNEYAHHGCRCQPCTDANNEYYRQYNAAKAAPKTVPEPLPGARHGTIAGYATDRCRCQPCRDAMAQYSRERRKKRSA